MSTAARQQSYHKVDILTPMNKSVSLLLATAIILGLPLAIWVEHQENFTWTNRLFAPRLEPVINRHTPGVSQGTFLPPLIQKNTTLSSADNPVIIPAITTIAPDTTLTIQEGVTIYVHEYGALLVKGTLTINGRQKNQVVMTTNEMNMANQVWSGIITEPGGQTNIQYTQIAYASPAVTCGLGANLNANHVKITYGNLGLFAARSNCILVNSLIKNVRDGIVAQGEAPATASTIIQASRENIKIIPQ